MLRVFCCCCCWEVFRERLRTSIVLELLEVRFHGAGHDGEDVLAVGPELGYEASPGDVRGGEARTYAGDGVGEVRAWPREYFRVHRVAYTLIGH